MKTITRFGVCGLLFASLILLYTGCTPAEESTTQVIEKQKIQLGQDDIRDKNPALYEKREFRGEQRQFLTTDFSAIPVPASLDEVTQNFHTPPVRQWNTGTCWCFAATSFMESELHRLGKGEIKLSEMFSVYWQYVEKARRYIQEKGTSSLGQGSEPNAVVQMMKMYGAVRAQDYSGLLPGETTHNHGPLNQEIRNYLALCKQHKYWDEEKAVESVKLILNKHLGVPPEAITVDGREMTPAEYLSDVLELPLDDYVSFMSFKYIPFYTQGKFRVQDNWWQCKQYYNLPLQDFMAGLRGALENGYTAALGGDTSETGKSGEAQIAFIPTFDIHPKLIDQDSREFRYTNRTTTDDHDIHCVGYTDLDDHTYFLIKDSGRGAQSGSFKGYSFLRDDYVKLKIMIYLVHKDAASELLAKF